MSLKIFIYLLALSVVCYFNVCKLIGWNPANMYLLKVKSTTLEKGMKYGVFIANFERISLFSVFLLLTLNR